MKFNFKNINQKKILFFAIVLLIVIPGTNIIKFKGLHGSFKKAKKPSFSTANWFDGSFQNGLEKYVSDRVVFRNLFIRINNQISYTFFNEAKANGVIIGKENYLYEEGYILAHLGKDFIGEEKINDRVEKLKFIQDTLKRLNKDLLIILAAGKGSYYPEYIPDKYEPENKTRNNYEAYRDELVNQNVNLIDFNDWFLKMKDTSSLHLYPKCGTHWSKYGEVLAADSMLNYIHQKRNINLPKIKIDRIEYFDKPYDTDDDIEKGMNLLFDIPDLKMAYAIFNFDKDSTSVEPKVLTIADSFYWGMYNFGLSREAFDKSEFWFYNNQIYSAKLSEVAYVKDVDYQKALEANDVIILMSTEANLRKFPWGFINKAYEIYKPK